MFHAHFIFIFYSIIFIFINLSLPARKNTRFRIFRFSFHMSQNVFMRPLKSMLCIFITHEILLRRPCVYLSLPLSRTLHLTQLMNAKCNYSTCMCTNPYTPLSLLPPPHHPHRRTLPLFAQLCNAIKYNEIGLK